MTVSYEQPMRESLKTVMDAINTDIPKDISSAVESVNSNITAEINRAKQAENNLSDADKALSQAISDTNTSLKADITAEYKRANTAENNLSILYDQLSTSINSIKTSINQLTPIVDTIPDFEYGYSDSVTIPAANTVSVDITFNKEFKETPQVFTELMCNTLINILVSHVTYVDTTKCTIKLYNGGTTEVQNVTVDYLALAGR